ncbi:MAG: N-acetylglucosamine-6-phosphate deacetylase [Limnochordales bacterium]|nr:N-acetylglucosamine-6-phosphate deacetylase [Limnochordales bacterium]
MPRWLIQGGTVVTAEEVIPAGVVLVEGEKIAFVGKREDLDPAQVVGAKEVDATRFYVVPGFVDVHIHGGGGCDALDGTVEALTCIARTHALSGTTSFLATTATASAEELYRAARAVRAVMEKQARRDAEPQAATSGAAAAAEFEAEGADVVGMHLEGPYLAPSRKGAQNESFIRPVDEEELQNLLDILGPAFRMMTIAPEMENGHLGIQWLVERGITASIGHTDATYEQTKAAIALGASHATHTFNAMRGLHHRDPGTVGAVLTSPGVYCELIADGIHVHPGAMRVLYEVKGPDRLVLVTDSLSATGMPEGVYELAHKKVIVKDGSARLETGELAGSTLGMGRAVANMVKLVGVSLLEAVRMGSLTPARSVGIADRKGSLTPGKDADLLLLDSDLNVVRTMIRGAWLRGQQ